MPTTLAENKSYAKLKKDVERVIRSGRREVEQVKARTYWETGRLIAAHIEANGGSVEYGKEVMLKLSQDLKINKTHLYYSLEFYSSYEIFPALGKLGWTSISACLRSTILKSGKRLLKKQRKGIGL